MHHRTRTSGKLFVLATSVLIALISPLRTLGDDASRGVAFPAPRSCPPKAVKVKSTSLNIGDGSVSVRLMVEVTKEKGSYLEMTMPPFGWMGEAEPYPNRNFPELRILVDGSAANIEDSFRAFSGKDEITDLLKDDKIDPFVVADTPPFLAWKKEASHSVSGLEQIGAIEKADNLYVAKWQVQRIIAVALAAGAHEVAFTYNLRPAYRLSKFDSIANSIQAACLSAPEVETRLPLSVSTQLSTLRVYTIPVSIWGETSPRVEAQVDLSRAEGGRPDLVAFCGQNGKAVTSARGRLSGAAQPDSDGNLYLISIKKATP